MMRSQGRATGLRDREVGRILLGNRQFSVVVLPEVSRSAGAGELCRFDLAGQTLAVIDADDAHEVGEGSEALQVRLTGRELEIAVLVARGHANKIIAHRLRISEWTVATYLRRIFLKLGVESRAAMVFRCAALLKEAVDTVDPRDESRAGRKPEQFTSR